MGVHATKTVNGLRVVDIPERLKRRLGAARLAQVDEGALVFSRPDGTPVTRRSVQEAFKRVLVRAGLPDMRLHDLRHTYATTLLQSGIPPSCVAQQLGHASEVITHMVYSHVTMENRVRMRGHLDEVLGSHSDSHSERRKEGKLREEGAHALRA